MIERMSAVLVCTTGIFRWPTHQATSALELIKTVLQIEISFFRAFRNIINKFQFISDRQTYEKIILNLIFFL